ncbi:hypothetical protein CcCBS67573_g01744 [Chytriomyces confervae]|uniref:Potassium channel tetramerisation-type BTB domain-containing protein n=1 Tax=Chytriomyces confervae TaxID=246404 RepID=A0A507FNF7_9FUNG|nr:hypothetical protein CcCBS67573_g01744 [Chytriomyces confervae]
MNALLGYAVQALQLCVYALALLGLFSLAVIGLSAMSVRLEGGDPDTGGAVVPLPDEEDKKEVILPKEVVEKVAEEGKKEMDATNAKYLRIKTVRKKEVASVSKSVSDAAIRAAVLIKQSPIPDAIAALLGRTMDRYKKIDSAFAVNNQLVSVSQQVVKHGLNAASIAAGAAIKASVAYQTAPSYRDLYGYETDTDSENEDNLGSNDFEVFEDNKRILGKKRKARKGLRNQPSLLSLASTSQNNAQMNGMTSPTQFDGPAVRIIKLDASLPGGFPHKETIESSVATDSSITGIASLMQEECACAECGRMGPYRMTPFNDGSGSFRNAQKAVTRSKSDSLLGTLYNTSTNVAGRVVTASSTYFLGKETTEILLGPIDPNTSALNKDLTPEEAFLERTTLEIRAQFEASPIRSFCVGGVFVATSLRTLLRARGSKLQRWFSPIEDKSKNLDSAIVKEWIKDGVMMQDGTFFIDRDGTHFKHVINHLRGLALSPLLDSRVVLEELRREALFYGIVPLIVEIDERLLSIDAIEEDEIRDLESAVKSEKVHHPHPADVNPDLMQPQEEETSCLSSLKPEANLETPLPNKVVPSRCASPVRSPSMDTTPLLLSPEAQNSTASPSASPASITTLAIESSTSPEQTSGLRLRKNRKQSVSLSLSLPKPLSAASPIPAPVTAEQAPATLFSSAFSFASSFIPVLPTVASTLLPPAAAKKSFTLANPDESDDDAAVGSDSDSCSGDDTEEGEMEEAASEPERIIDLPPTQLPAAQKTDVSPNILHKRNSIQSNLSGGDETTCVQHPRGDLSATSRSGGGGASNIHMPTNPAVESVESCANEEIADDHSTARNTKSHDERLLNLLMKRRQNRVAIPSSVEEATTLLNSRAWDCVNKYNSLRAEKSLNNNNDPYNDLDGRVSLASAPLVSDLESFVETVLSSCGMWVGMPPPPRNDVLMNASWAFGVGAAFCLQIGILMVVVAVLS